MRYREIGLTFIRVFVSRVEVLLLIDAAILTVDEMYRADAATMAAGVPGLTLMEAAGWAIARAIRRRWRPRPVVVLCGPGNNGGDGFVAARLLAADGWPVRLGLLGSVDHLKGDAAVNSGRWRGPVFPLDESLLDGRPLVVDGLFGAGLARPVDGIAARLIEIINSDDLDCVGIDVPSGVSGDSGEVNGVAPRCRFTISFFRPKPGHLLLPGRVFCGELHIADIGIPESVLPDIAPQTFANVPALWRVALPRPAVGGNKYNRGHTLILGGAPMSGAARLAADAARRMGAGLVTIATPAAALVNYAAASPGTILAAADRIDEFAALIEDRRRNSALLGPGAGVNAETRGKVLAALATGKPCVLDADALTVFADDPQVLFSAIRGPCLMTPHQGEFARVFDVRGDKLQRTRIAAATSGATVLLKGPDTVIAAPDGRAAITFDAPPTMATAGSGDVLSGFSAALLAQGMEPFLAAAAAAWLHGRTATAFGPGLIAEDLINGLPAVLTEVLGVGDEAEVAALVASMSPAAPNSRGSGTQHKRVEG